MYADELIIERTPKHRRGMSLRLAGCLNANTYQQLEDVIFNEFDGGHYNVELHLEGVQYMTSAGAGVLVNARCEANKNNGEVVIVCPSEQVSELLDMLGLAEFFSIKSAA